MERRILIAWLLELILAAAPPDPGVLVPDRVDADEEAFPAKHQLDRVEVLS